MTNKGDIKTQYQYENEVELRGLYREACLRGEMTKREAFCSLVFNLGFGKTIAERLVSEWRQEQGLEEAQIETFAVMKRRQKRQGSLEKKVITRKIGKKTEMPQRKCSDCKFYKTCSVLET